MTTTIVSMMHWKRFSPLLSQQQHAQNCQQSTIKLIILDMSPIPSHGKVFFPKPFTPSYLASFPRI